jgi:hypothetical protein
MNAGSGRDDNEEEEFEASALPVARWRQFPIGHEHPFFCSTLVLAEFICKGWNPPLSHKSR